MSAVLIAIAAILGGGGGVALLIAAFVKSQKDAGKAEEKANEQREADAAKDRANVVLGERRDVDDTIKRLRDKSF